MTKLYRLHALCALLWLGLGLKATLLPPGPLNGFLGLTCALTALGQVVTALAEHRRYVTRRVLRGFTASRRYE
jgi:hypothetical protein